MKNLDELRKCKLHEIPDWELDEYVTIGLMLKPSLSVNDIIDEPFGDVMELLNINSNDYEIEQIYEIIKKRTGKDYRHKMWYEVFYAFNHILKEINRIHEIMSSINAGNPTANEIEAGIDMYNEFGVFATIDRIAGGDPLKYDQIERLPFKLVFAKMKLNYVDRVYSDNMRKILMRPKR